VPRNVGGLTDVVSSPAHATAVGLLLYGLKQAREGRPFAVDASSIRERVVGFFKELF
jgi:cell division ATPase FtsA